MMLTKDYVDVQKWYYNSLKFTSFLHRGSSTISWSHKGFSWSLFSCFGLGRSTRKYAMVSHQCAQLSLSVVPIGKRNNQQIPLLSHADWNSFRNSFNSGPPFWNQAPADSSQIPPRLCALCCTCSCCLHLVSLIFLFCSYDRSLQQESWGCRAGPGAVCGSLSPALCVQR